MKTQILGIGSTILSDDSAGVRVIERLKQKKLPENVILTDGGTGGLVILDLLEESDKLIIVDAFVTGEKPPGTVHHIGLADLKTHRPVHLSTAHGFDIYTVLEINNKVMGATKPSKVEIIGIEAEDVTTFSEECTPSVHEAIDRVVLLICDLLSIPPLIKNTIVRIDT